jgi:hypothetical protein
MGCGCGKSGGGRSRRLGSVKSTSRNRSGSVLSSSRVSPINNSSKNRKRRDIERKRREQILKKFGKL